MPWGHGDQHQRVHCGERAAHAVSFAAPGTTYNDTGLAANTRYSYRVRATDTAGNLSPYSNVTRAAHLAVHADPAAMRFHL